MPANGGHTVIPATRAEVGPRVDRNPRALAGGSDTLRRPVTNRRPRHTLLTLALVLAAAWTGSAQTSSLVYPGQDGWIISKPDNLGDRVPNFSRVGYRYGEEPLPDVQFLVESNRWFIVSPVVGDDQNAIQSAIDQVEALTTNAHGFRGVVQLTAGLFTISNQLTIRSNGVVLRGVGDGSATASNTILRSTSSNQVELIEVDAASGSRSTVAGTTHAVVDKYVPVGATSFRVDSTANWSVGDRVVVDRPATTNWVEALGMDSIPQNSDGTVVQWQSNLTGHVQRYERVITRLEGDRVFLDAPIPNALEQEFTSATVYRYTFNTRLRQIGIENLRGEALFNGSGDENHAWTFINYLRVEDSWIRNITARNFGFCAVELGTSSTRITVEDCQNLDPQSQITGGRRYAFNNQGQLNLLWRLFSELGRHDFVNNSPTRGPNVFYDGLATNQFAESGPHQRWSTGTLYDNLVVEGEALAAYNRGNFGTGHGWSGANMVFWNSKADTLRVENPFTAQNWVIGCMGTPQNPGDFLGAPLGTFDSTGTNVTLGDPIHNPAHSLYVGQRYERLLDPTVQLREYALGDFDRFVFDGTNSVDSVPVDAAWLAAIQPLLGGAPTARFDVASNDVFVPFTFNFALAPGERVVGATLALALRRVAGASTNDSLWLEGAGNELTLPSLGLAANLSTNTNAATVLLYEFPTNTLPDLNDGRLNGLIGDDVSVDWATLSLRVATIPSVIVTSLTAVADAYLRGGSFAETNFGNATSLPVKASTDPEFVREAMFRFDLGSVTGRVVNARLRLFCSSVSDPVRNEVAWVADDSWGESTITWSNAPGAGSGFAEWSPAAGEWVDVPVTWFVQQALTNDDLVSFRVYSRSITSNGFVNYTSSEGTAAQRPRLVVTLSNSPPTLSALANRTLGEDTSTGPVAFAVGDLEAGGGAVTLTALSANTNLVPTNRVTFGGSGTNRNFTILPATNQFGAALITITASDPHGLASNRSFTLTVTNINDPPVLDAVSNRALGAGQTLLLTNVATDLETNALTFALLTNPPGATLGVSNGVLVWRPLVAQADTTNLFRVRVTDNGAPNLSATQQFNVVVNPLAVPLVTTLALTNSQLRLALSGDFGPDYTVQATTNLVDWTNLFTTNSPTLPFNWTDTNAAGLLKRFYRVLLGP
jgi:hypothetical protein